MKRKEWVGKVGIHSKGKKGQARGKRKMGIRIGREGNETKYEEVNKKVNK